MLQKNCSLFGHRIALLYSWFHFFLFLNKFCDLLLLKKRYKNFLSKTIYLHILIQYFDDIIFIILLKIGNESCMIYCDTLRLAYRIQSFTN